MRECYAMKKLSTFTTVRERAARADSALLCAGLWGCAWQSSHGSKRGSRGLLAGGLHTHPSPTPPPPPPPHVVPACPVPVCPPPQSVSMNWRKAENFVSKRYMKVVDDDVYFEDVKLQVWDGQWLPGGAQSVLMNAQAPPRALDLRPWHTRAAMSCLRGSLLA